MAKRLTNQQEISSKITTLSDTEAAQVLDYINTIESKHKIQTLPIDDELINYLADARENRCARQVIEWERVRRRADSQDNLTFAATNRGK
ncbi:MAG: hypothetical protein WAQ98_18825 [Blastocatellia bacterium]